MLEKAAEAKTGKTIKVSKETIIVEEIKPVEKAVKVTDMPEKTEMGDAIEQRSLKPSRAQRDIRHLS